MQAGFTVLGGAAGGPPGLVIGAIIDSFLAVFRLFGGGGGLKELGRQVQTLARQVLQIADKLLTLIWRLARAVGHILAAFHTLWVRWLQPLLEHISKIVKRVNEIVDKVLRPYLDTLLRIRKTIDMIYNTVFRPLLLPLETIRKMLTIGRMLHIGAAKRADDRIRKLEGQILAPIRALYGKVNESAGYLNILITARSTIQSAVFLSSAYENRAPLKNILASTGTEDVGADYRRHVASVQAEAEPERVRAAFAEYTTTGAGELAEGYAESFLLLRQTAGEQLGVA